MTGKKIVEPHRPFGGVNGIDDGQPVIDEDADLVNVTIVDGTGQLEVTLVQYLLKRDRFPWAIIRECNRQPHRIFAIRV
ncbi:hypothetical protein [Corynebacterium glyciniphilum]|uniref:hypothetical protein n=1 Tax=Corynebacterium glyciniphilum TaxID=1404244 RepID=UPI003DA0BF66